MQEFLKHFNRWSKTLRGSSPKDTAVQDPIREIDYHGVTLHIENLPAEMRQKIVKGAYETNEIMLLPNLISTEDKVLEIGSAIGFISLYCKKVLGVKTLVTVEANPETIKHLKRNYELNDASPNLIAAALSPEDRTIDFFVSPMFWTDSLVSNSSNNKKTAIKVRGVTFESLINNCGINPTAIIIDIEGAEQYITLDHIPPTVSKILIETHAKFIGIRKAYSVLENLIKRGFWIEGHVANCWALKRSINPCQ